MPPINVLIYSGPGTSPSALAHATHTLTALLTPHHAVHPLTPTQLLSEPWPATCALLVIPGGADTAYTQTLEGEGNRRIQRYVHGGGKYLGLCAGGYYGCRRCEWEVGRAGMEVVGERSLGFFPGVGRGSVVPGFVYRAEVGARAVGVKVERGTLVGGPSGGLRVYVNGGGLFVGADGVEGVEVLARYEGEGLVCEGGDAAVVFCRVGDGAAVLTGPHPEFDAWRLDSGAVSGGEGYAGVVASLREDEGKRVEFMKALLVKLGLRVNEDGGEAVPALSELHLSDARPGQVGEMLASWREAGLFTTDEQGQEMLKGEANTFTLTQPDDLDLTSLRAALPTTSTPSATPLSAKPLTLIPHSTTPPPATLTPSFNHSSYFENLTTTALGRTLLYAPTTTSTTTLLEKNPTLLSRLPTGFTVTATTQLAGRGRGTNVWVSPKGALMFSTVLRHSMQLSNATAPVVLVQYLAALAVVEGIKSYGKGYEKVPVKLKWPNDIYALDPSAPTTKKPHNTIPSQETPEARAERERKKYVKIGGILVNSSYTPAAPTSNSASSGSFTLTLGIGLNLSNPAPTTSLTHLTSALHLGPPTPETLLAKILNSFETLYTRFCRTGFDGYFEKVYYEAWLHSGQVVSLEGEGGVRVRIRGVEGQWGMLITEEVEGGRRWEVRSDSNSFDFFRGLVGRKV